MKSISVRCFSTSPSRNSHRRLRSLCGVLAAACILTAASTASATDNLYSFDFTNTSGVKATDLHVEFLIDGSLSLWDPQVTAQPGGAPTAAISYLQDEVNVIWGAAAIDNGQSVSLSLKSTSESVVVYRSWWTEYNNNVSNNSLLWPVAAKPAVIGNFGTFEEGQHGGLDIVEGVDKPVRAIETLTLVATTGNPQGTAGNYIYLSDGTNLFCIAHIKKTQGAHGNDFVAGDVGTVFQRGQTIGFVTGHTNPLGGSFDHIHLEFTPNLGDDGNIKINGVYKTAKQITDMAQPEKINPFLAQVGGQYLWTVKDPDASSGDNKPEFGPMFFRPIANTVAGFHEYGKQESNDAVQAVRRGTFINGQVDIINEITDNQGGIQPPGGSTTPDTAKNPPARSDPTIHLRDVILSNPYKVSYEVHGTGPVAGGQHDVAERVLVTFNKKASELEPQMDTIYDRPRDVDVLQGPDTLYYNHCYVLTNTDDTNQPAEGHAWNTMAMAGQGGGDGFGAANNATRNANARFPDGIYEVKSNAWDIGPDGQPADKTSITYKVRVNNWKQTALPGSAGDPHPIDRANDTFDDDTGKEVSKAQLIHTYAKPVEGPVAVYAQGENYLPGGSYKAYVADNKRQGWKEGDLLPAIAAATLVSDADGHIVWAKVKDMTRIGMYDLIFDYDDNHAFSWTLDGLGRFDVIFVNTTKSEIKTVTPIIPFSGAESWSDGHAPDGTTTAFVVNDTGSARQVVVTGQAQTAALYVAGGDATMTVTIQSGASLGASNSVDVVAGGCIDLDGGGLSSPDIFLNDGKLVGSGTISTQHFTNAGILSPGHSPGITTITGDYTQDPLGILEMEIAGTSPFDPIEYDQLIVSGNVVLDGTLDVVFLDDFQPARGNVFDILDFDLMRLSGTFDTINLPGLLPSLSWDTSALYTEGLLMITPEPATLSLLVLGGLLALRRRRR